MTRVELTAEASAYVAARIANYEAEAAAFDSKANTMMASWARDVSKFGVLPLYHGWTESIGLRHDGLILRWSNDADYEGTQNVDEPIWVRIALVNGSKQYPVLQRHIPPRPTNALTCENCHGTGTLQKFPTVICQCGGIGWVDEHTPK